MKTRCFLVATFGALFLAACASQTDHEKSQFGLKKELPANPAPLPAAVDGQHAKPLDLNKRTFLVLQVDGGGIMGITPACLMEKIDAAISARSRVNSMKEAFSVCAGTSTGSIIAGMVAAGVPGNVIADYYRKDGYDLFTSDAKIPAPIWPLFKNRYRRDVFQGKLLEVLGRECGCETITLDDMYDGPLLIIPAFDLCSKRTHFFRTRDSNDRRLAFNGDVQLLDAISASALSAPVFFGKLPAPGVVWDHHQADGRTEKFRGAVYNDGGQGTQNSAIAVTALESLVRNWANDSLASGDQVVMISLGCGNNYKRRSFDEMRYSSGARQTLAFLLGNQARSEASLVQWTMVDLIEKRTGNIKFFRFDWVPDRSRDKTGVSAFAVNQKQRELYLEKAEEIAAREDFKQLMKDLRHVPLVRSGPRTERPALNPVSPAAQAL